MKIAGLGARQKRREEKSDERCLVSKQQLTLGAVRAAGWVPEFPCFCLRLHILFLRNLTRLTSLNMSGFTLPSDTQSQCTVIESLYESKSHSLFFCLFIADIAMATKSCVLQRTCRLILMALLIKFCILCFLLCVGLIRFMQTCCVRMQFK